MIELCWPSAAHARCPVSVQLATRYLHAVYPAPPDDDRPGSPMSGSSVDAPIDGETKRVSVEIFQPLVIRRAVDEVVSVLVDAIHGGLLEPGDRFPREVDLAERLAVSRNTVNQAIARLERAGVVSVRRGARGGAVVISHRVPADLLAASPQSEPTEIEQWVHARRPIETKATMLAAERMTKADLKELRRLTEMLPALLADDEQFLAVDLRFHVEIGRITGNSLIASYLDDLMRRFLVLCTRYPVGHTNLEQGIRNQRQSLDAFESGNVARMLDACDQHCASTEEHFLGYRLPRWQQVAATATSTPVGVGLALVDGAGVPAVTGV
jgi:GntR family transcriptional repressor for pyruvate dehydrogenase complex